MDELQVPTYDGATLLMPEVFAVTLTVKFGAPYSNSRSSHGNAIPLQLALADGYSVFHARVKQRVAAMREVVWSESSPIMLKPMQMAPQEKYEELSESDDGLEAQMRQLWARAVRQKSGQGAFRVELFVYVQKVGTTSVIHRVIGARIASAAAQINEHYSQQPSAPQFGSASRSYWVIQHAHQTDDAQLEVLSSTTFTQPRMIDEHQRSINDATSAAAHEPEYVTIRCKLNGGTVPPQVHLANLRQQLGLPHYALIPPFWQPIETTSPAVNMEDVDHAESEAENMFI